MLNSRYGKSYLNSVLIGYAEANTSKTIKFGIDSLNKLELKDENDANGGFSIIQLNSVSLSCEYQFKCISGLTTMSNNSFTSAVGYTS